MRTGGGAEDVVGRLDARDPVAVGLVDGVLEGARAGRDRNHLGSEEAHARNVQRLPLSVDLAHVHGAVEAEQRRGGGGGDAVLAGSRLGDDTGLPEALGQQRLTEHVVDLMGTCMVQIFSF